MKQVYGVSLIACAALLAGCATSEDGYEVAGTGVDVPSSALAPPPGETAGAVVRAASVDGDVVNHIHFYSNGAIRIVPEDGDASIPGTYEVRGDQLCLTWTPRGTECWPYAAAFQPGQPVTLTSDRGQTAVITLVSGSSAAIAPVAPPPPPPPPPPPMPPEEPIRAGERG